MPARALLAAASLSFLCASVASAQPVTVTIDQSQSSISVVVNAAGSSDSDSSPITGTIDFDLDTGLAQVTLTDFDLALTQTLNLTLTPPLSSLAVTGSGVAVQYQPGQPATGPVALGGGGAFTFMDVPSLASGTMAYVGSGLVCLALNPCSDSVDLETDIGPQLAESLAGTLVVNGSDVELMGTISLTLPIPEDGSLGTATINAVLVGSGSLPVPQTGACVLCDPGVATDCTIATEADCTTAGGSFLGAGSVCPTEDGCPCDWNCDGFLNDQDFFDWANDFFGGTGPVGDADYTDDGFQNDQDFFDFVNCFFSPPSGC